MIYTQNSDQQPLSFATWQYHLDLRAIILYIYIFFLIHIFHYLPPSEVRKRPLPFCTAVYLLFVVMLFIS